MTKYVIALALLKYFDKYTLAQVSISAVNKCVPIMLCFLSTTKNWNSIILAPLKRYLFRSIRRKKNFLQLNQLVTGF